VKRPLVLPEPIPDSEEDRTEQAMLMIGEIQRWPLSESELTTFEAEIAAELREGKACTRTRFKIVRDAYQRIKKRLNK
jgi:hypothetical protein